MALNFKTDDNYGYTVAALFGVPQATINEAKKAGVTIAQSGPGKFSIKVGDYTAGTVVVTGQAISLAKAGSLGPASKQGVAANFIGAMKSAMTKYLMDAPGEVKVSPELDDDLPNPYQPYPVKLPKAAGLAPKKFLKTPSGVIEEAAYLAGEGMPSMVKSKIGEFPALGQADELYQAVKGTSPGSTYFVFALLKGAAVAVRFKGDTMSVRVEGVTPGAIHKYADALVEAELEKSDPHYSAHFTVDSKPLAVRVLGVLIAHIGLSKFLKAAEPTAFVNKYFKE